MRTILVTGGCGFIGSNFILQWRQRNPDDVIINLDLMTYAADEKNLSDLENDNNYDHIEGNICDKTLVKSVIEYYNPEIIYHFAAESHVDNSINDSFPFVQTNVLGTVNLLDQVKAFNKEIRFIHVSTDEVYGSLKPKQRPFEEDSRYEPNSPYSASKASSDHFVRAYHKTHGLNTIITNCCNNYGPRQHREKFIPTVIANASQNLPVPVYGNGANIREWIYVDDHCDALIKLSDHGSMGESYCIGTGREYSNIDLAKKILNLMGKPESLITFVEDRKGHDFRYALNSTKMHHEFWVPRTKFDAGLEQTIAWYLK